ncbi:MAG: bifunctional folylpolyglutamate synthase/dihydrofolate synthase [Gammaproteobacteria bacterium]|nr:bifunctional folylpolyglutamate synthase/dihydrofolate synthase [Gammaproteobacteria bacterium]
MSHPGSFQTLAEWLAWLETLSPNEIELGLERVDAVLARLCLELTERVVHVAGTNGKGSCAAMLEGLLIAGGDRVGCYTSPHVFEFNERIRVDGRNATDAAIVQALETVESARDGVPLTYFEYSTLAALCLFADNDCSALVLEIGMGGRLDAVNAIEPLAGLITNVALDHCDWLGNDVETIAREKAGIMRHGKPLVFGALERPVAIDEAADATGARLYCAGRDFAVESAAGGSWSYRGLRTRIPHLAAPALFGQSQLGNAAAVLAVLETLSMGYELCAATINDVFAGLSLAGRFQRISSARHWVLDVAHNPHAAHALAANLREDGAPRERIAIIGALLDKDPEGIVAELAPLVDRWIAVSAAAARAIPANQLAARIAAVCGKPCLAADSLEEALEFATSTSGEDDSILVTGSFYVVGPALEWIRSTSA